MKKIIYLLFTIFFTAALSSCGSATAIEKSKNDVAGYTLKNKKELMQQKVLNKKNKTVIVLP